MPRAQQLVLPLVVDSIVMLRKQRHTVNEIARRLHINSTVVSDAIRYAEAMGRLSGKELRVVDASGQGQADAVA